MNGVSLGGFCAFLIDGNYWLNFLPVLVAVVIGLLSYWRLSPPLRALALLACFDLIAEVGNLAVGYALGTNLFLFPYIIVGEAGLLLLLYGRALQSAAFWRVAPWVLALLAAFAAFDETHRAATVSFRPALQVLSNLLALALPALYFRKLLNEVQVARPWLAPLFWVSAVLLVVALGDLFISLFSNYLYHHFSAAANKLVWQVHGGLVIFQYLVYSLALWRGSRPLPVAARP